MMKLKHLQMALENVSEFQAPKVMLEQYPTSPHLASQVVNLIETRYSDIVNKSIADLGCGCGMLSIAAAMIGAKGVVGYEVDEDAIAQARETLEEMELNEVITIVQANVLSFLPAAYRSSVETHEAVALPTAGKKSAKKSSKEKEEKQKEKARKEGDEGDGEEEEEDNEEEEEEEEEESSARNKRGGKGGKGKEKGKGKDRGGKGGKGRGRGRGGKSRGGKRGEAADDVTVLGIEAASVKLSEGENEEGEHKAWRRSVDTVIMNPPFGTRISGIDMVFLWVAINMCRGAVYSLHKSSTRQYILKTAAGWGVHAEVVAELRWDIQKSYAFHSQDSKDIEVDLLRFTLQPPVRAIASRELNSQGVN